MSETKYLKCPCQKCGDSIEFPARGIGTAVNCPHCEEKTTLFAPPIEEAPVGDPVGEESTAAAAAETERSTNVPAAPFEASAPLAGEEALGPGAPRKGKLVWISLVVLVAAGLAAAGFIYKNKNRPPRGTTSPEERAKISAKTPSVSVATNLAAVPSNAPPPLKSPKSLDDLKVGTIALEKAKGSSLVYAVGVLRNDSEHQRFGVTIELALSDARGNKAGTAKDYRAVIEPHQEWRFRALVLDSKAVSAQVERIREEE